MEDNQDNSMGFFLKQFDQVQVALSKRRDAHVQRIIVFFLIPQSDLQFIHPSYKGAKSPVSPGFQPRAWL